MAGATAVGSGDVALLVKRAFERLGHEVRLISTEENLPLLSHLGYRLNNGVRVRSLSYSRHVYRVARAWQPDLIYFDASNPLVVPCTLRRLKREVGCPLILWEVNNFIWLGHEMECIPYYDHIYITDSYMIPVVRRAGGRSVSFLAPCADPAEHFPVEMSPEERAKYGAEVTFIGAWSSERAALLGAVTHRDLRIYGYRWEAAGPPLADCVREEPVLSLTKNKIFSASDISIHVHREHMLNGDNFRVSEIAACHGAPFSTYRADLAKAFEPGKEVIIFDDPDDFKRKVDYYLSHPDELRAVGEAAYRRVLAEHTYDHRAREIVARAQEIAAS